MLVLSRQVGESVMIGREILVEVTGVDVEAMSAELVIRGASAGGNGRGSSSSAGNSLLLRRDESCQPAPGVTVTLVDVRPGNPVPTARLGIDVPPHMDVHRSEVFEAIKRENRRARPPNE